MRILPAKSVLYVNYSTVLKNWQCELIFSEKIMIDLSRYDCLRWQAVNVQSPFLYVESNQPSATLLVLWWQHVHVTAMLFNKVDMANVTNYLSIAESTFAKFLNSRVAVNPGFGFFFFGAFKIFSTKWYICNHFQICVSNFFIFCCDSKIIDSTQYQVYFVRILVLQCKWSQKRQQLDYRKTHAVIIRLNMLVVIISKWCWL